MFERSAGVLLHVSSLPGPHPIGDLGPMAVAWIDWLAKAGCRYWQVLPLGPTGFGGSPYASPSSFGGNLDLLSPDWLREDGLIDEVSSTDTNDVTAWKRGLVASSRERTNRFGDELEAFRHAHSAWLDDHSLFVALKEAHGTSSWDTWEPGVRERDPEALADARRALAEEIELEMFGQFLFHRQMARLRAHALSAGVELVGDMPLYAAHDSVDVWARPDLFALDPETLRPLLVAGVPPDPFAPEGQRWGMPTYRWEEHAAQGFGWWVDRFEAFLEHSDVLRLDHFTGFHKYFAIPGYHEGPITGEWHDGPGIALFEAVADRYGEVPMIVEDLGPMVSEVEELRRKLGRPGMRVMQEAFEADPDPTRLLENFPDDCVVYTGTHDNDTAVGRIHAEDDGYRTRALAFTGGTVATFARDLVAATWQLPQVLAIAPLQDLLGLGSEARMNMPGSASGNWRWRAPDGSFDGGLGDWLREVNEASGRAG